MGIIHRYHTFMFFFPLLANCLLRVSFKKKKQWMTKWRET